MLLLHGPAHHKAAHRLSLFKIFIFKSFSGPFLHTLFRVQYIINLQGAAHTHTYAILLQKDSRQQRHWGEKTKSHTYNLLKKRPGEASRSWGGPSHSRNCRVDLRERHLHPPKVNTHLLTRLSSRRYSSTSTVSTSYTHALSLLMSVYTRFQPTVRELTTVGMCLYAIIYL